MKICRQALYVQIIDGIGTVRACGWAGYYLLGNLRDNTMSEVYNSEAAKRFRQTLIEGTYDYCNEENCPYMANNILESQLVEIEKIPEYPEIVSLAYDRRCNYHCTCCISRCDDKMDPVVQEKVEREIRAALPYVKTFSANGLGEFFVSDSMMELVSEWKPEEIEGAKFELETNGSLLNEKNWKKVENIGGADLSVTLTIHSFEEAAYQYLSGTKMKISQMEENLRFVKKLREEGKINFLEIAMVMQERNFRTLPDFIDRCLNEFGADKVRVRRFLPEKAMDENIEWFFDIRNPLHPYHQEYLEVMKHPVFNDPRVFKWTGEHLSNRGELPAKANYKVLKDLFLTENVGEKLSDYFLSQGYRRIILYAITDIAKAIVKVLQNQPVKIEYIYDRNTCLGEWEGLEVRKPLYKDLKKTKGPLLVTLVPRHGEMEGFLRHQGYEGKILCLEQILENVKFQS
ncbi:MAG: radical SAM protein [Lachnospiraceae bacterium]|nr:radical SAM protein [Lachnospiraceae bacterium]